MNASNDPAALERMRRLGGEKLLHDLIDLFLVQTPERMAAARRGAGEGNAAAIQRATHSLKSSAGQLGACGMQALCERAETLAEQKDVGATLPLLDDLDREYEGVRTWLLDALPRGGGA